MSLVCMDNGEDFDYNSDGDCNWDDEDLDIVKTDDNILKSSRQDYRYKCWKCAKCENINNVKLAAEKEDMRCCGCNQTYYIPDETNTFQCSKWHNHSDYLLRIGVLKQSPVWICNQCTFQNKTIDSKQCEMCQSNRNPSTTTKTISFISSTNTNNIITNLSDPKWRCSNCNGMSTSKSKCNICGCHKAQKFNNTLRSELLTFGYLRELNKDLTNIQIYIVIYKLCQWFYTNYGGFGMRIIYQTVFSRLDEMKYKKPLKAFLCTGSWKNNLFGEQLMSINQNKIKEENNNKQQVYMWKIKLTINESVCDELEDDKSDQKRDNIKLWGVTIGIVSERICRYAEWDWRKKNVRNMYTFKNTYGIYGNGSKGKYKQFCRHFMENDTVTLRFDSDKRTLSYGINEYWYGIAYNNIENNVYKFGVFVEQKGVAIESLEFVQY